MAKRRLPRLFERFKASVAYLEFRDPRTGDLGIGTAFHVGDGVLVTAKHVLHGKELTKVGTVFPHFVPDPRGVMLLEDGERYRRVEPFEVAGADCNVFMLPDGNREDVAAVRVHIADEPPAFRLGHHLDDWISDGDMVLARGLVLGYPPIPCTTAPALVAVSCEINAVVRRHDVPNWHFVISAMARGGFSGGPVVNENGFVMGLVAHALGRNDEPEQLGFMTVLNVEAIFLLLGGHALLSKEQVEPWEPWDDDWYAKMDQLQRVVPEVELRGEREDDILFADYSDSSKDPSDPSDRS